MFIQEIYWAPCHTTKIELPQESSRICSNEYLFWQIMKHLGFSTALIHTSFGSTWESFTLIILINNNGKLKCVYVRTNLSCNSKLWPLWCCKWEGINGSYLICVCNVKILLVSYITISFIMRTWSFMNNQAITSGRPIFKISRDFYERRSWG